MKLNRPNFFCVCLLIGISLSCVSAEQPSCGLELPQQCNCSLSTLSNPIEPHTVPQQRIRRWLVHTTPSPSFWKIHAEVDCYLDGSGLAVFVQVATDIHRILIDKLTLHGLPLHKEARVARFPNMWLNGTRIRQLQIKDTLLANDFLTIGRPLAGQEHTLIWMGLNDCYLSGALTNSTRGSMALGPLKSFHRLLGLDLSFNHLVVVQEDAFAEPPAHLVSLLLHHNDLHHVQSGAFAAIRTLRTLDLSHNKLYQISRDIFAEKPEGLAHINLSWNYLTAIPDDFFENMPSLKEVDASHNYLHTLSELPFIRVWGKVDELTLDGNFFECDCDLEWIFNVTSTSDSPPTGQCSRTLPNLYVQHFELNKLKKEDLDCRGTYRDFSKPRKGEEVPPEDVGDSEEVTEAALVTMPTDNEGGKEIEPGTDHSLEETTTDHSLEETTVDHGLEETTVDHSLGETTEASSTMRDSEGTQIPETTTASLDSKYSDQKSPDEAVPSNPKLSSAADDEEEDYQMHDFPEFQVVHEDEDEDEEDDNKPTSPSKR